MGKEMIFTIIWCVLAVLNLGFAFTLPFVPMVLGIAFGLINLIVVGTVIASSVLAYKNKK